MARKIAFYAKLINQRAAGGLVATVTEDHWTGGRKCHGGRVFVRGPVEYSSKTLRVVDSGGNQVFAERTGPGYPAGQYIEEWMFRNELLSFDELGTKARKWCAALNEKRTAK